MASSETKTSVINNLMEHHGGLLLAFFLHLTLLSFLLTHSSQQEIERTLIPQRVDLMLSPVLPPATAQPEPTTPSPTLPSPPVATYVEESQPVEKTETKTDEELNPVEEPLSATSAEVIAKELAKEKSQLEKKLAQLENQKNSLRSFLEQASQVRQGRPFSFTSVGAGQGAIRTLDVRNTPKEIVQRVFAYYGIKISLKYVADDPGFTYLNSAQTRDGLYLSRSGAGLHEVFELSRKAMAKMSSLESQEIINRSLDPERTRVLEVVFGIVKQGDGYDLGITKFKAEEIR